MTDDQRPLEEVDGHVWGDPPADATPLMARVYALRHKPLAALTPEDLRLLITQEVSLDVLVPRALQLLQQEPLIQGDLHPGDLLTAVLHVSASYWPARTDQRAALEPIIQTAADTLPNDVAAFKANNP